MKVLERYLVFIIILEVASAQFLEQPYRGILFAPVQYQVTLTCSVEEGYLIDWHVSWSNGDEAGASSGFARQVLMERNFTLEGVITTRSTLSLWESIINNATNITCLAQETGARRSLIAGNTVQVIFYDAPPPPTDLTVIENELSSFNISWSLGFIEGVPVNYTLTVLNLNTTNAQSIVIAGLLDQHYVFETNRSCDVYSFTVTAVTAAGNSTSSQEIILARHLKSEMCTVTTSETSSTTTFTSFSLPAIQTDSFQPLTTSSSPTRDNSTVLIAAFSIAFAVLMTVLVLVNVMICVFCYKKNTSELKPDLKDPVYEAPSDIAVVLSSVKNRETPFAMTSSSAYGISHEMPLEVPTTSTSSKNPDTECVPFAMTLSSAYDNLQRLKTQDNACPSTLPSANEEAKNSDTEGGTVPFVMTSSSVNEIFEKINPAASPSADESLYIKKSILPCAMKISSSANELSMHSQEELPESSDNFFLSIRSYVTQALTHSSPSN